MSQRVKLKSVNQIMIGGKDWIKFFNNPENNEDLIKFDCIYYRSKEGRRLFEVPLVIKIG